MRSPFTATLAIAGLALAPCLALLPRAVQDPASAPLDLAGVKALLTGMGHEMKDLSESKVEISITEGTFTVPIGVEVSSSGRYIWLTAFLGTVPEEGLSAEQANALLRQNHAIQPAQFYLTSSSGLMVGLAIENRAMDAVIMKRAISKVAADVASTSDDWTLEAVDEEGEAGDQ